MSHPASGNREMAEGSEGVDSVWGHPHWAHSGQRPHVAARGAVPSLGTGQSGRISSELSLTSMYIPSPALDHSLGSQAYLTLPFPPNTLGLPTVAGRGLLGHGDAHSHCPQAEGVGDTILERPGGTPGRPVPGPLPVQVLWAGAAVTLFSRPLPPSQRGREVRAGALALRGEGAGGGREGI